MKTLFQSLKITVAFCVIFFVGYVLVLWGFGAAVMPNHGQAQAAQVGQSFSDSTYFWGRPSAVDYDGGGSGASNKGVTNPDYLAEVSERITLFLAAHPYLERSQVPSELVTASGSGLDPHISPEAAAVQIQRVAQARSMTTEQVTQIVAQHTEDPWVGKATINLLLLNTALDEQQ